MMCLIVGDHGSYAWLCLSGHRRPFLTNAIRNVKPACSDCCGGPGCLQHSNHARVLHLCLTVGAVGVLRVDHHRVYSNAVSHCVQTLRTCPSSSNTALHMLNLACARNFVAVLNCSTDAVSTAYAWF